MKKNVIVVLALLFVVTLSGCGGYKKENKTPIIEGARNIELLIEDGAPNYLDGVTARDEEDGDLTSSIEVNDDGVDYDNIGSYDVVYTVTDSNGATAHDTVVVTISDPTSDNSIPRFAGLDSIYVLVKGESFKPSRDLKFKVVDEEDLDIANELMGYDAVSCTYDGEDCMSDSFNFTSNEEGDFMFFFSVKDSEGATKTGNVIVRVIEAFDNPRFSRVDSPDQRFNGLNTLVVGSYEPTGNFVGGFMGNAYDGNITGLLYGMSTIVSDKEGNIIPNMTVLAKEPEVSYGDAYTYLDYDPETNTTFEREVRDLTYTYTLNTGLKFSDGTPVRPSDYKFAAKLASSYAYGKAGATTAAYSEIIGYEEWNQGCTLEKDTDGNIIYYLPANGSEASNEDNFTKVAIHEDERVSYNIGGTNKTIKAITRCEGNVEDFNQETLDFTGIVADNANNTISITIKGSELPYFFIESLVGMSPLSEQAYTQGGEYNFNVPSTDNPRETEHVGEYVRDYLKTDPPATSGPYEIIEYVDGVYVKLAVNIHYPGDFNGQKPLIDTIVVRFIDSKNEVSNLQNGDVDLVVNVVEASKIDELNIIDHTLTSTYARNGYGMLSFHTDMPIVGDVRVRQAMMYLLDRESFVDNFLGTYGYLVHGPYGRSQWMYDDSSLFSDTDNRLNKYDTNLDTAIALLEDAGWIYGGPNQEDYVSGVRYNADGEMLKINWLATQTDFTNNLKLLLTGDNNFSRAGMLIEYTEGQFNDLLDEYYYAYQNDPSERTYHMFNLATGIGVNYDPYYSFHSDWLGTMYNINQYDNPEADRIIERMREINPNDEDAKEQYLEEWENFMVHMNENLPFIPIYSNIYHTYSNYSIKGFEISPTWSWTRAILYCEIDDSLGN